MGLTSEEHTVQCRIHLNVRGMKLQQNIKVIQMIQHFINWGQSNLDLLHIPLLLTLLYTLHLPLIPLLLHLHLRQLFPLYYTGYHLMSPPPTTVPLKIKNFINSKKITNNITNNKTSIVFDLSKTSTTTRKPKINDNHTKILTITDQLSSLSKTVEMLISANNNTKNGILCGYYH